MINLFHIENEIIDTSKYSHVLHDSGVDEFEKEFAEYVGAKYACGVCSATNIIFLAFQNFKGTVSIPTMIPPVVANGLYTAGCDISFYDDPEWVGNSYILHDFGNYKIIDSAQKVEKNQFVKEANPQDLMFFSFYPTKPIGSIDGGMIVSNDPEKIKWFKEAVFNGMSFAENNWERKLKFPGWKMYLNSVQAEVARRNFMRLENKYSSLSEVREKYNEAFGLKNSSNHLYRISVENNVDALRYLKENQIIAGVHYTCLHQSEVYKRDIVLPRSENESKRTVSIPFHEKLTDKEINHVIEKVKFLL